VVQFRQIGIRLIPLFALALVAAGAEPGARPLTSEYIEARAWFDAFLPAAAGAVPPDLPFSFTYDGRASGGLLPGWRQTRAQRPLDAQRQESEVTYTDPRTGLEIRCVAVAYRDFPTVEWTVYFRNTGAVDTPILAGIQALDARWTRAGETGFLLHHELGTFYPLSPRDFLPQESRLESGQTLRFIPSKGRPSGGVMPYFNLERSRYSGVILAVGWPGAWAIQFARDTPDGVRVTAGQELTHLRLHPGEEIRTPLMAVQFWRGSWISAQNGWRRWMLAHNLPRPGGRPPAPFLAGSSSLEFDEMVRANEKNQLFFIDRYRQERLPLDCWWMDAGWYVNHGRWQEPIVWEPDPARFPHGLRPVTDHAHRLGLKTLLWFEPERVMPTNALFRQHPEWLLPNLISRHASQLFYLGNPAARAWLTDMVSRKITEEGIDIYRQDFNVVEPVQLWRSHDAADRQGITENHHIVGYLAFWDELLRRHPGLVIDSCAGGGSRNDLETMRRALPFWRSDYRFDPVSNQCQTYGLALWLPYFGTGTGPRQFTPYELRSNLSCPLAILTWDMRDPALPYADLRRAVGEWRDIAQNYSGDFYPLTPCSLAADTWLAWQYDRPEAGRGVVQAFRRAASAVPAERLRLCALDPIAVYLFSDVDHPGEVRKVTGRDAMDAGLEVAIPGCPGAVALTYEKLPSAR